MISSEIPNHFSLPQRINRLADLSYNFWWVWNPESQRLFQDVDKHLWNKVNHNPVAFLHQVERPRLNAATNNKFYLDLYDRVIRDFDAYMKMDKTWFKQTYPHDIDRQIAYFSFEFGLHESLPVYAGGLGILAGDHLKEASDMGIPLVGVGFIYNKGYFSQRITEDGWQETRDQIIIFEEEPIIPLVDKDNNPLMASIDLLGHKVWVRIWKVQVGRVSLYLLDSNVEQNTPFDRDLTSNLYSNNPDVRISQEIVLGIGGVKALRALGLQPTVWHMNEGHSAFLTLERVRELIADSKASGKEKTFAEASIEVRRTNIFTTHTPVPAGNDVFQTLLVDKYFGSLLPELRLTRDEFLELGHQAQDWGDSFSMPVLALKLSERCNAVSELHGQVSRKMWNFLWPTKAVDDVPISHITNGVHMNTWLARRMRVLYGRYLGADWLDNLDNPDMWAGIDNIPDSEIWLVRRHLRRKLLTFIEERARLQWLTTRIHPVQIIAGGVLLDPYALTIGFARRFATYKRGNLILRDVDRLINIVNNTNMPVQFIFAGKAHPADELGKKIIQKVYWAVKDAKMGGRLVFLEDYDMNVARYLVQGVDVWMNTPRRPYEASGTSGMKAAMNGVLNFSVLDGWWREGFNGHNGWGIGEDADNGDWEAQDAADAESLYSTLENDIVPLFYNNRSAENYPVEWIKWMRQSIRTLAPQFSTRRMVKEYMTKMYEPALKSIKPAKK
ncbi:MAG TPA: alpha-glucan family phosphorylase [Longilinea sp.]|nr:alpha-glucan family phosphorylase [Longilinea sp.]